MGLNWTHVRVGPGVEEAHGLAHCPAVGQLYRLDEVELSLEDEVEPGGQSALVSDDPAVVQVAEAYPPTQLLLHVHREQNCQVAHWLQVVLDLKKIKFRCVKQIANRKNLESQLFYWFLRIILLLPDSAVANCSFYYM